MEIDIIDAKILRDLLKDGRKHFSEIAKEAGVSKDIIGQHYKKLKENGIIVGATVQLNYEYLDYSIVGEIYITVDYRKRDQLIRSVKKLPHVYGAYIWGPEPEICVVITLKNIDELDKIKHTLKRLSTAPEVRTKLWIEVRSIVENLSVFSSVRKLNESDGSEKIQKTHSRNDMVNVDETDIQIINILSKDSRLAFQKIANELNISTDTVCRRYRKLKQNHIIKPLIQVDLKKLSYCAWATFNLSIDSQVDISDFVEEISLIPDIVHIIKISGIFDLYIIAVVRNMESFLSIQEKISSLTGIRKIETKIVRMFEVLPGVKEYISTF